MSDTHRPRQQTYSLYPAVENGLTAPDNQPIPAIHHRVIVIGALKSRVVRYRRHRRHEGDQRRRRCCPGRCRGRYEAEGDEQRNGHQRGQEDCDRPIGFGPHEPEQVAKERDQQQRGKDE